ncbi:LysE family transporter, partial [Sinorhizobium sp. 6-117]|uniref:LysE family transporter n=1 Tax=Sinorhizobium sp. 6-117 TaxID=3049090 RepID=UPI0024C421F1
MSVLLFGKGLLLGLAIAAPVGPIGALCISRTLTRGFWAGVAGGLGTALADAAYAMLAAVGFAAFAAVLSVIATPLKKNHQASEPRKTPETTIAPFIP